MESSTENILHIRFKVAVKLRFIVYCSPISYRCSGSVIHTALTCCSTPVNLVLNWSPRVTVAPICTSVMGFSLVFKGVFSHTAVGIRVNISSIRTGNGNAVIYRYIPYPFCRCFASYMLIAYNRRRITCIYRVVTGR